MSQTQREMDNGRENTVPYWTYLLEKDVKSACKHLPVVLAYALQKNLRNQQWLL